jgi:ribosomal protein S27E
MPFTPTLPEPWGGTFLRCGCHACQRKLIEFISANRFVVCETCGYKRCPHATDHQLACTGSNEPGQPGSRFER